MYVCCCYPSYLTSTHFAIAVPAVEIVVAAAPLLPAAAAA